MCELFGMSSRLSTNVTFSLSVLVTAESILAGTKRMGIAFHEGCDFVKEAATDAEFIEKSHRSSRRS